MKIAWGSFCALFMTMACGSPAITIDVPDDSEPLFGAVRLSAAISGGDSDTVTFYLDDTGTSIGVATEDSAGDHSLTWFSTATNNGAHTIIATAEVDGDMLEVSVAIDVANLSRAETIPTDAVKMTPADDAHPPILEPTFAALFEDCVPLAGPVNSAGAEDSPYITADGQELYTFFTPDASVPPELQLVDGVTGIYRSVRDGAGWSEPERVWLNHHDDPSLDGCTTVFGDELWFCTARAGVERSIDIYVAHRDGDDWVDWASAGSRLNVELLVGELHLADGGDSIYYHSERAGSQGMDIWHSARSGGEWGDAVNLTAVNSEYSDGWPWLNPSADELWLTTGPAAPEIWRALKVADEWQAPDKVVAPFAGEATFDTAGNLYFTHHFWDDENQAIIEADIYVCMRK
jgi:hypothetical protein